MLKTICLIIISICVLTSLIIFPTYVGACFPKKGKKSLLMKMVLSTMFIIIAVSSLIMTNNTSEFTLFMLIGFVFAWIGDLFLGKGNGTKLFLVGLVSFFFTHVFYIIALIFATQHYFPDNGFFTSIGMTTGIIVLLLEVLLCITRKPRFHKLFAPIAVYSIVLITMFSKSCELGLKLFPNNRAAILLPIGAFFFLFSDTTLAMQRFRMHKKVFSFKACCSISYFVGQMLIAMSLAAIVY